MPSNLSFREYSFIVKDTSAELLAITLPKDARVGGCGLDDAKVYAWNGTEWVGLALEPPVVGPLAVHALFGEYHDPKTLPLANVIDHDLAAHHAIGLFNDEPVYTEAIGGSVPVSAMLVPAFRCMWNDVRMLAWYLEAYGAPNANAVFKLRRGTPTAGTVIGTITLTPSTLFVVNTSVNGQEFVTGEKFWLQCESASGVADIRSEVWMEQWEGA